ncbi:MAG: helix-turn-helix transcriptional regulator [Bacteroidales bacterium]|nr:helix-turn-helix transcriptional regulator [Bacteroidales bacterium]
MQKRRGLTDVVTKEINYEESPISDPGDNLLVQKIKQAFEEDKVYLDSMLTIESLAHKLGTNKSTLSRVINETLDRNFPTLLNDYRVKYALELFNDPKNANYTIEAIAELSGYNSRQVFHKAFKSRVGVPPRRFRN